MPPNHRRTRRQVYTDESNRDSWEQAKVFRNARNLMRLGYYGRGHAIIAQFRGAQRRGNMVQNQDEMEIT